MNIYVGNLSSDTSEEDLKAVFGEYGLVASVMIARKKGGDSMGYAHIEMPLRDEGLSAIKALSGRKLRGSSLIVAEVSERVKVHQTK